MLTPIVQRWRDGRSAYRPAGETIQTRQYEVAEIADDTTARAFIAQHHYLKTLPAARARFGLYTRGELVGVAVYSVPVNARSLDGLPGEPQARTELGRLVLTDQTPANGESFFIAQTFRLLRAKGFASVQSFCDPVPRNTSTGEVIFPGHVGTIYQATNATYCGRATARTLRVLDDGSVVSERGLQKIRAGERGWRGVAELLQRHGAAPLAADEDRSAWLRAALAAVTRPLRHPGNHRYVWSLDPRDRKHLPESLPYPKLSSIGGWFPVAVGH